MRGIYEFDCLLRGIVFGVTEVPHISDMNHSIEKEVTVY